MGRTEIAAHRGAWGEARENTLEALEHAARLGATWVEFDVRRLGDGSLVLFHDAHLGDGSALVDLDRAGLDARTAPLGLAVPGLEQALRRCRRLGLKADIERKEIGTEGDTSAMVQGVLDADDYVYTSFHDRVIARLKGLDRHARAGLLLGRHRPDAPVITRLTELFPEQRLRACGADFVAPNWRLLRLGLLRRMRELGLPVWVWTVNDDRRLRRLLNDGVDMLITDAPARALALRASVQPASLEDAVVERLEPRLALASGAPAGAGLWSPG